MRIYLVALCTQLLFSCYEDKLAVDTVDLNESERIAGIELASIPPGCYWQMDIVDSMLVLNDGCHDDFFHFYDVETFAFQFSGGTEGRGPNDFQSAPFLAKSEIAALAISEPQGLLKYVDINDDRLFVEKSIALNAGGGSRDIIETNDRIYGKNTSSGSGMIFYQNSKNSNSELKWIPIPPAIELIGQATNHRQRLSDNFFAVNESAKRVISGTRYFNNVFVFDWEGNVVESYEIDFPNQDVQLIDPATDYIAAAAPIFFNAVFSTGKYVYLLWHGLTFDEMDRMDDGLSSKILVFNWSGNFVKSYTLDGRIATMAVSPDDKKLLAAKMQEDGLTSIWLYEFDH